LGLFAVPRAFSPPERPGPDTESDARENRGHRYPLTHVSQVHFGRRVSGPSDANPCRRKLHTADLPPPCPPLPLRDRLGPARLDVFGSRVCFWLVPVRDPDHE